MARPKSVPETPQLAAPKPTAPKQPVKKGIETRLRSTRMHHIFNFDVNDDGRYREVAVLKLSKGIDNSISAIHYVDIALMDNVDKGRLKALVTNVHADKYELWDLMSQNTLNNGKNALDYFHQLAKVVNGSGAINTAMGGGLAGVQAENNQMIGSQFTDTGSGALETQAA